jgi:hypothetical protein
MNKGIAKPLHMKFEGALYHIMSRGKRLGAGKDFE